MRKKSSSQVEREALELLREARRIRAQEAKTARDDARYRQCILGVCLQQEMIADPVLMARFEAVMNRFCTRPRDRELFGLAGATNNFATTVRADVAGKKRGKGLVDGSGDYAASASASAPRDRAAGLSGASNAPGGASGAGVRVRASEGAHASAAHGSGAPARGAEGGLSVAGLRTSAAPNAAAAVASASLHTASVRAGAE